MVFHVCTRSKPLKKGTSGCVTPFVQICYRLADAFMPSGVGGEGFILTVTCLVCAVFKHKFVLLRARRRVDYKQTAKNPSSAVEDILKIFTVKF